MLKLSRATESFPSVSIRSHAGGQPVEVTLIGQIGAGSGSALIAAAELRQRGHPRFVDALDEPSARLAGMHVDHGDTSSLYSFVVGPHGHPFHCHAGHRMFTAISGSAGTELRFSTVGVDELERDPANFVRALEYVQVPPDSLFTVRFGPNTWHQFVSLRPDLGQPALFALSCHPDELGGELDEKTRAEVMRNEASIPSLTRVLPEHVVALMHPSRLDRRRVSTTALTLHVQGVGLLARFCTHVRSAIGRLRAHLVRWRGAPGYLAENGGGRAVRELASNERPPRWLLNGQLPNAHHQDAFELLLQNEELPRSATGARARSARHILAAVLDGFLQNPPFAVSRLMQIRNVLVKPLGLRTSPLGCPVSSLLAERSPEWFDERFPVWAQAIGFDGRSAEVILGADDKHLRFRTCVRVEMLADGRVRCLMGTRVETHNRFGSAYLRLIDRVHRRFISPTMLRFAVAHALRELADRRCQSELGMTSGELSVPSAHLATGMQGP